MVNSAPLAKIAFIFDDRLSHDRKTVFTRTMTILKSKLNMDVLPSSMSEHEVLEHVKKHDYALVLMPWYKYLSWKKLESHFGALRLQGATTAGYFADAILPFEFSKMPNFNRLIMLDFYRLDQQEMEMMLRSLSEEGKKMGLSSFTDRNTQVFFSSWYNQDHNSTRCIDSAMAIPLFRANQWSNRVDSIRLYLTALWSLCFRERHSMQTTEAFAELEISEVNKRLAVKLVFESNDLTLKHLMHHFWPTDAHDKDSTVRELIKHSDFMRVNCFPETHHVEFLAFFTPEAPSSHYPGEVRGFWIEPLKNKFLIHAEVTAGKRIPIQHAKRELLTEQIHDVLEALRAIHMQLSNTSQNERALLEHQVSHIRFLVHEIEKKVAEKKKVA